MPIVSTCFEMVAFKCRTSQQIFRMVGRSSKPILAFVPQRVRPLLSRPALRWRMIELLQIVIDALSLGSLYALVALGIGLLFGILRLVNFAHGDFITVGCYALIVPSADVTARLLIGAWNWAALVPAICLIVVVAALLTDALVFRPLRRASS